MTRQENCCYLPCEKSVKARPGNRCGGVLFGTRDDPGDGCGRFFCSEHLVGTLGPYYCHGCWAKRSKRVREEGAPRPSSPSRAAYLEWVRVRATVSGPELRRLTEMATLMGLSFTGWLELAYYAGMDEARECVVAKAQEQVKELRAKATVEANKPSADYDLTRFCQNCYGADALDLLVAALKKHLHRA